ESRIQGASSGHGQSRQGTISVSPPRVADKTTMTVHPAQTVLRNGEPVTIRRVRPDDEALLVGFHRGLSDRTVYQRYFHMMGLGFRIAHDRLARICAADGTSAFVLVMEHTPAAGPAAIVGVARLTFVPGSTGAEFAVLVTDEWQGLGGGTALTRALIGEAEARALTVLQADVLADNVDMQRMCRALGMVITPAGEPGVVRAELTVGRSQQG
ncbi:MAG: GNAT family N-acetyltransferase, partial [Vicinamibacterales bacterium]|nr:GNAT family N-acetyltransferase [Vicinamibacterales bacterium]